METPKEQFITHGTYTVSNAGGYEIMLNRSGDAAKVKDGNEISNWLPIEFIDDDENPEESIPVIDPKGYNIRLDHVMRA
jgi:hypothetical protein